MNIDVDIQCPGIEFALPMHSTNMAHGVILISCIEATCRLQNISSYD